MYQDQVALKGLKETLDPNNEVQVAIYNALLAAPDHDYTPLTDEVIVELALEIFRGHIWFAWCYDDEDAAMFMPWMLCDNAQRLSMYKLGACFYEHVDKAGPRSVNGRPSFFSMRIASATDWEKVVTKLEAIKGAVAAV